MTPFSLGAIQRSRTASMFPRCWIGSMSPNRGRRFASFPSKDQAATLTVRERSCVTAFAL